MKLRVKYLLWFLYLAAVSTRAQQVVTSDNLALSTDASATQRFVAAHGERAVLMGYAEQGLEAWAYPFQILSGYRIGFQAEGATSELDGQAILKRLIYCPDSITRIYIGPDYIVREKLFVPIDRPAAVISYEVQAPQPIHIIVHFTPVLNLMWPGALGGQSTSWNAAAPGYVISEPSSGISAVVGSPQIVTHDQTANSTTSAHHELAFTLQPVSASKDSAVASVVIALQSPKLNAAHATVSELVEQLPSLQSQSRAHYSDLEQTSIRIHTPDHAVNVALDWANIALNQAWVCNDRIGCGVVAGYGPSRGERRPQYDWFFAGDGLVTINGLLAAGQYARAREELEFIMKYQDKKIGMIWHELSQSAGYIDWSKYPYMYVHVDISFDYLATVGRYVSVTGDLTFANDHWQSIEVAYRYCQSLIRPSDHLPHIPNDKEGGNEQERPDDDLGLSSAWVAATETFANLAKFTAHAEMARDATEANKQARSAIAANYWDSTHHFWIDGHTSSGAPIFTRRSGANAVILQNIFSPQQDEELLDQLSSAQFQTDWGMRGVASDSPIFNPYSYATGSIFALNSTNGALTFWKAHRPEAAFALWKGTLNWNALDSIGHLHEVLAGNFYYPQLESVPEQTWSSAGLLTATMNGLLGLEVDGAKNELTFAPHLPSTWTSVSVDNVKLPHATLSFTLRQTLNSVDLDINNQGDTAARIFFEPGLPLGARDIRAAMNGAAIHPNVRHFSQEEQAQLEIKAPPGFSHYRIDFTGGVSITLKPTSLQVGDRSSAIKIRDFSWLDNVLSIKSDACSSSASAFDLRTPLKLVSAKGATVQQLSDAEYELTVPSSTLTTDSCEYRSTQIEIEFDSFNATMSSTRSPSYLPRRAQN